MSGCERTLRTLSLESKRPYHIWKMQQEMRMKRSEGRQPTHCTGYGQYGGMESRYGHPGFGLAV
jgi:hypothetical protein